uniref:Protein MEMO1 n=1 Tax=Auxenochlorella protothecoides TaxID=3075 RepID=A0A1D1ZU13_AUXPR
MATVRAAYHAGTWYDDRARSLEASIRKWMEDASHPDPVGSIRALIGPHAGFTYCGHVLAHAYKGIDASSVKRVFVIGPSHHFFSRRCLLSPATIYRSPLGDVPVDSGVYDQLKASGAFDIASLSQDEEEHSIEMHCPFIQHVMRERSFTLVPIIVGALSRQSEAQYARILAPFLQDPGNLFAISSDFCHWGSRFQYTRYDPTDGAIHESIKALDARGMAAIASGDAQRFADYLQETGNTICGRHAIAILLQALAIADLKPTIAFNKYDQSSACTRPSHSSVSYASGIVCTTS